MVDNVLQMRGVAEGQLAIQCDTAVVAFVEPEGADGKWVAAVVDTVVAAAVDSQLGLDTEKAADVASVD